MLSIDLKIMSFIIALSIFCPACGDKSMPNYRNNPSGHPQDADEQQKKKNAQDKGAEWRLWPCENVAHPPATNADGQVYYSGKGPHQFPMTSDFEFSLDLSGKICTPKQMGRDIVIMVDVAKNMRDQFNAGSDPTTDGSSTCGRLKAIKAMLMALEDNVNAKFALVTFDSGVHQASADFMDVDSFRSSYADVNILCTVGSAQTANFKSGLNKALDLLKNGRAGASKEVVLISNGIVDTTADNGEATVLDLHKIGIIGTLIVGASETHAKNEIASKTPAGNPLHQRVNHADDLPSGILNLINSEIAGGSVSYFASDDHDMGMTTNLDPEADIEFKIRDVKASEAEFPGGIGLEIEFFDTRGALYQRSGELRWKL